MIGLKEIYKNVNLKCLKKRRLGWRCYLGRETYRMYEYKLY
jgi:hypothetical protein